MKTANIRQLRLNFPEVLKWIERGEDVVITMRRKVVARLVPDHPAVKVRRRREDFGQIRKKIFGNRVFKADYVKEERSGYLC